MMRDMGHVEKFPIKHHQREMNRRGKMSLSCIVTDRWIKVGKPDWAHGDLGVPVEIEIIAAYSRSTGGDHKICSMIITVEQLRSLLKEIDGES